MSNSDFPVLKKALATLSNELTNGSKKDFCWILNPEDPGLLHSLDKLSSNDASDLPPSGGASIAAHTDHLRYSINLTNRAARGEDAFSDVDFTASWKRVTVTDRQWSELRDELRTEVENWQSLLNEIRELNETELTGIIAGIAHLSYHMGAIRQINRTIRGPSAEDTQS